MTKPLSYRQSAAEAAFFLLVLWLPYYKSLCLAGVSHAIIAIGLACLLMFLAVRTTDICRFLTACVLALRTRGLSTPDQEFGSISSVAPLLYNRPAPSALFQRPPPLFS